MPNDAKRCQMVQMWGCQLGLLLWARQPTQLDFNSLRLLATSGVPKWIFWSSLLLNVGSPTFGWVSMPGINPLATSRFLKYKSQLIRVVNSNQCPEMYFLMLCIQILLIHLSVVPTGPIYWRECYSA